MALPISPGPVAPSPVWRPHLPRCRMLVPRARGGALWVAGKDAGRVAGESELRNSPKRSGWEWGWASGSDGSRRGSNGSAAAGHQEAGARECGHRRARPRPRGSAPGRPSHDPVAPRERGKALTPLTPACLRRYSGGSRSP